MENLKEFIEVHALYDGKPACIRAACIEGVTDNAETNTGEEIHLACRTIFYAGHCINVTESYEQIIDMIWKAGM